MVTYFPFLHKCLWYVHKDNIYLLKCTLARCLCLYMHVFILGLPRKDSVPNFSNPLRYVKRGFHWIENSSFCYWEKRALLFYSSLVLSDTQEKDAMSQTAISLPARKPRADRPKPATSFCVQQPSREQTLATWSLMRVCHHRASGRKDYSHMT